MKSMKKIIINILKYGWYCIKNISSNKYFTIKDDKGISSQNVEVDSRKQKWLLTNVSDNEVILTSENNDILFSKYFF